MVRLDMNLIRMELLAFQQKSLRLSLPNGDTFFVELL